MAEESEHREGSEADLRTMLEARELEKNLERERTSRNFTRIVLGSVSALALAIWIFPDRPANLALPEISKATPSLVIPPPSPLHSDLEKSDPGLAHDLAPFTVRPGEINQTEDIRFAMQLLNFMDAPSLKQTIPLHAPAGEKKP